MPCATSGSVTSSEPSGSDGRARRGGPGRLRSVGPQHRLGAEAEVVVRAVQRGVGSGGAGRSDRLTSHHDMRVLLGAFHCDRLGVTHAKACPDRPIRVHARTGRSARPQERSGEARRDQSDRNPSHAARTPTTTTSPILRRTTPFAQGPSLRHASARTLSEGLPTRKSSCCRSHRGRGFSTYGADRAPRTTSRRVTLRSSQASGTVGEGDSSPTHAGSVMSGPHMASLTSTTSV